MSSYLFHPSSSDANLSFTRLHSSFIQQFIKINKSKVFYDNSSLTSKNIPISHLAKVPYLSEFQLLVTINRELNSNILLTINVLKNGEYFRFKNTHKVRRLMKLINIISSQMKLGAFLVHPEKHTLSLTFGYKFDEQYFKKRVNAFAKGVNRMIEQQVNTMLSYLYTMLEIGGEIDEKVVKDVRNKGMNIWVIDGAWRKKEYEGIVKNDIPILEGNQQNQEKFKNLNIKVKKVESNGQTVKVSKKRTNSCQKNNENRYFLPQVKNYILKYFESLQHKQYQRPSLKQYSPNIKQRLQNYVYVSSPNFGRQIVVTSHQSASEKPKSSQPSTLTDSVSSKSSHVVSQTTWTQISKQSQSIISKATCQIKEIMNYNKKPQQYEYPSFTANPIQRLIVKKEYLGEHAAKRANRQKNILRLFSTVSSHYIPKFYQSALDNENDCSIYMNFYRQMSALKYFCSRTTTDTKLKFLGSAIKGLRFLKDIKIVHTDLKLQNILVAKDLGVKISDFGESIHLDANPQSPQRKSTQRCTFPFVPCQFFTKDPLKFDSSYDTYSFGVMVHYLLTDYYILPYCVGRLNFMKQKIKREEYLNHLVFNFEMYKDMFSPEIAQILLMMILKSMHPHPQKRCNQEMLGILFWKIQKMNNLFMFDEDYENLV